MRDVPMFLVPVNITVISRRRRLADSDGVSGKAAIDGVVLAGLLVDDSAEHVEEVRYRQVKLPTGSDESTEIVVELADDSDPDGRPRRATIDLPFVLPTWNRILSARLRDRMFMKRFVRDYTSLALALVDGEAVELGTAASRQLALAELPAYEQVLRPSRQPAKKARSRRKLTKRQRLLMEAYKRRGRAIR